MCFSLSLAAVSAFFAQVIGFYLLFMTSAMLLQSARFKKIMTDLLGHQASLFICGSSNVLFGIVILVCHNVWAANWHLLITLIGWLTLVKGVTMIFSPDTYIKFVKNLIDKVGYKIWTWAWLLIGVYLIWMGLAQSM